MSFNSLQFYIFLPCIVLLYYATPKKARNFVLLAASYFFYANWRIGYTVLIIISTLSTYTAAVFIGKTANDSHRKIYLAANLALNLTILFVFKYLNFFGELLFPFASGFTPLDIILPVGISFYTFQALGYTIDVYRGDIEPEHNLVDYALFVSFFPQLVAGPIERSGNLLPQMKKPHTFSGDNIHEGLLLVLWGLFKKIVIADRLACLVNFAYDAPHGVISSSGYITAAFAFSLQIYCDFSAYSDIARGSAKMLGFNLMRNFNAPYTACSVREFWKKWHISLSTWFRDYLYIPLGGNRKGAVRGAVNTLVVFAVSGLWHGASLTFVIWGLLNGIYQVIENAVNRVAAKASIALPRSSVLNIIKCAFTFILITYAFIYFRASTLEQAIHISRTIFTGPDTLDFSCIFFMGIPPAYIYVLIFSIVILIITDLTQLVTDIPKAIGRTYITKYAVYFLVIMSVIIFGSYGSEYDPQAFIYFRF